ncbi:hypothetical protein [Winogradskyella rapida]|uniref:Uncharacterized protein n=1 Tax=Winogradskyella rapida TaxID=549701 RepID=A0ABW3KST1_9FLAO
MAVTTKSIETRIWNFCLVKKRNKEYPAAVVAAIFNLSWFIDETGFPPPPIAIQLKRRLETRLGTIGNLRNGNRIGKCAEVGAANKILRTRPTVGADRMKFTQAIRPRTMQKVPMCQNCIDTFT